LSYVQEPSVSSGIDAIVPGTALRLIQPLVKENGEVTFHQLHGDLKIIGLGYTLTTRLVKGEYPRYKELFPQFKGVGMSFNRSAMLEAIKVLRPTLDKNCNVIKVEPRSDRSSVTLITKLAKRTVDIVSHGSTAQVPSTIEVFSVNANYFEEAISSLADDKEAYLEFHGSLKPLVFNEKNYKHLLMPIQAK
jgi:DNA polymerase III sliding clamp (beta) subunit (PCNA family)